MLPFAVAFASDHADSVTSYERERLLVDHTVGAFRPATYAVPMSGGGLVFVGGGAPVEYQVEHLRFGTGDELDVVDFAGLLGDTEVLEQRQQRVTARRWVGAFMLVGGLAAGAIGVWGIDDAVNGSGSAGNLAGGLFLASGGITVMVAGGMHLDGIRRVESRVETYYPRDELSVRIDAYNGALCGRLGLERSECAVIDQLPAR